MALSRIDRIAFENDAIGVEADTRSATGTR